MYISKEEIILETFAKTFDIFYCIQRRHPVDTLPQAQI